MSYSEEIKAFLSGKSYKRSCCAGAYEAGRTGVAPPDIEKCCGKDDSAYLCGLFISFGSVNEPSKQSELSLRVNESNRSVAVKYLADHGLFPKTTLRRGKIVIYFKDNESIGGFLALVGASKAALAFIESKVIRTMSGAANRLKNAEVANLDRTATAAAEQVLAIKLLRENREFQRLSEELRMSAEIRENNPELSLEELRKLFDPPISKSGLNHRMAKLVEMAGKYK